MTRFFGHANSTSALLRKSPNRECKLTQISLAFLLYFNGTLQGEEQKDETVVDAEFKEKEKDEEKK